MRRMLIALVCATCLSATRPADAAARTLTMNEAVELAMRVEPTLAEAYIAKDRSKLAVLRAQLDRVSLKIDGSISELFNKSNIGGPTVSSCEVGGTTLPLDASACAATGGDFSRGASARSGGRALRLGADQKGAGFFGGGGGGDR